MTALVLGLALAVLVLGVLVAGLLRSHAEILKALHELGAGLELDRDAPGPVPVTIDGVDYFDGGVHSPTNADVLLGEDLDLVIVSSPMSAAHGRSLTLDAAMRASAHRRLEREVRRLRGAGMKVVRFEPTAKVLGAMGLNAMDADGTQDGFDLELIRLVRAAVTIPVIASGGAGAVEHFPPAVGAGADAVLAATVFHFGTLRIGEVKRELAGAGHPVR